MGTLWRCDHTKNIEPLGPGRKCKSIAPRGLQMCLLLDHRSKGSIALWGGLSLPKACPGRFLLVLLIFAEQTASPRACTCCLHRSKLSRSQSSTSAPWLGPAGTPLACKDTVLFASSSLGTLAASLQPAPCTRHRSPNPSRREAGERFSHPIHPHPLHGLGFFSPTWPGRGKLSP